MHRGGRAVLSGLAALSVGVAGVAEATTMIRLSTEELTVMSELVVEGRVTEIESRFHDEHQYVYTYVTVEVATTHKGQAPGATVVLEELGGFANGMNVRVPGSPEFEVGERVVVFTETKEVTGYPRTVAMAQGKFRVVEDASTGEVHLVRPEIIDETFNVDEQGRPDSTLDTTTGRRPYDTFVATVARWSDRLSVPGGAR